MELYISDLHLGSPLFESSYYVSELLGKDYDKVVIVGDLFDIWEDSIDDIVKDNIKLVNVMRSLNNLIIVTGNHDPSKEKMEEIFPNASVCDYYADGKKIFIHGHEFDYLVTKYDWAAKLLFPLHWVLERLHINMKNWIVRLFHSISAKKQKKYYNDLVLAIEKDAVKKYKDKFDVIIMGHTHLPKLVITDGVTYINVGDWTFHNVYCEFDGVSGRHSLIHQ